MDEWTVRRLTGEPLRELADQADEGVVVKFDKITPIAGVHRSERWIRTKL